MFAHITDLDHELAVGSYPSGEDDIRHLAENLGIRAVVSLQSDQDLVDKDLEEDRLAALYAEHGLQFTRVPVTDFDRRDLLNRLDRAVAAVQTAIAGGHKVYVHCNAGLNRSTSTVISYVAAHRGLSMTAAVEWLLTKHQSMPYPDVLEAWAKRHNLPM